MSKLATLQNALNSSGGRPAPLAASTPGPTAVPAIGGAGKPPSRVNQDNISAWLHKDFKRSIRLVQAKKQSNATLQDLMAEAFNDLFSKYNVPTVNQE